MTFESNYEPRYSINREVRHFPKGWQHPRDPRRRYIPLHQADYLRRLSEAERAELVEANAAIGIDAESRLMPDTSGLPASAVEIATYETTSEGTPVSPAFPDTDAGRLALARWCAEHCTTWAENKADAEAWAAVLFGGTLAFVSEDGRIEIS